MFKVTFFIIFLLCIFITCCTAPFVGKELTYTLAECVQCCRSLPEPQMNSCQMSCNKKFRKLKRYMGRRECKSACNAIVLECRAPCIQACDNIFYRKPTTHDPSMGADLRLNIEK